MDRGLLELGQKSLLHWATRQGLRLAVENEMLVRNREQHLIEFAETVLTPGLPGLEANKHPFSLSQSEVVSLPFTT